MDNGENDLQPVFSHVEPVLAVQNIEETISYWQNTLGFPAKWTWGEPPNHGGVSWQKVFIQFSLNPELATISKGNSIWIRLKHIEVLYHFHKQKNAEIVIPLENKPWGTAEYTVREINGYYLHFAGAIAHKEKSAAILPQTIQIIGRKPTANEYLNLSSALNGSSSITEAMAQERLQAVFAVVAEETVSGKIIGSALLLSDNASFYYVKDVMVHPEWQGKQVGTAMMRELTRWLEKNAANHSLVALIARETLEPFYQQFGFAQAFSMIRYIQRDEEEK